LKSFKGVLTVFVILHHHVVVEPSIAELRTKTKDKNKIADWE